MSIYCGYIYYKIVVDERRSMWHVSNCLNCVLGIISDYSVYYT
jgi:hypothetical protein